MDEQWKQINEFPNYEVSTKGRIRSVGREVVTGIGRRYAIGDTIMVPMDNGKGYLRVQLYRGRKTYKRYIHRLVAEHFIPNPQRKKCVNHIDNNPSNNSVENLEWCTHRENMEWARTQGRMNWTENRRRNQIKGWEKHYIAVVGENIQTGEMVRFAKLNDVKMAGFQPSCVCNCCKGKREQHKGYRWFYETETSAI